MSAPPPPPIGPLGPREGFQRDEPTRDLAVLARSLRDALREAERRGDDPREVASLLGRLGDALRVLGSPREAIVLLERGAAMAVEQGDPRLAVANELRLAVALQYANDRDAAARRFHDLLERRDDLERAGLLDFALQHDGKRLAEEGLREEARARLEEALAIRRAKGAGSLVRSTEAALEALFGGEGGSPP